MKFSKIGDISRVILCILDGVGFSDKIIGNAWAAAVKPVFEILLQYCPYTLLNASQQSVGLPKGQMGSSEVGHATIGAGRVILQELENINKVIRNKNFEHNEVFLKLISVLQNKPNINLHIIGLISDGGIHSHISHVKEVIKILGSYNLADRIKIHVITDGRDAPQQSAVKYLKQMIKFCNRYGAQISTISGRYYAMDRDKRDERTKLAYQAIANGISSEHFNNTSIIQIVKKSYAANIYDEFIIPSTCIQYNGMNKGDCLLSMNFRADRIQQILDKLTSTIDFSMCVSVTEYSKTLSQKMNVMFPSIIPPNTLGEIIEKNGYTQLRIAETEKYAHVTFFFNGGREDPFNNENRILIPSPQVRTYDLKPEMSANEITAALIDSQQRKRDTFICVNYANADMVGHTGDFNASVKACEVLDSCIGKILNNLLDSHTVILITADHGNVESEYDSITSEPCTQHTINPVPFILVTNDIWESVKFTQLQKTEHKTTIGGNLSDIAPTILQILNIQKPEEMTGKSLLSSIVAKITL